MADFSSRHYRSGRDGPRLVHVLLCFVLMLGARTAWAQGLPGDPLGRLPPNVPPGGAQPPGPPGQKPQPTHAASGAESGAQMPTQEPSLPEDPNAIDEKLRDEIGSDAGEDHELGRTRETERHWYGLWYSERSGNYGFRTLFPFWMERRQPNDRASLFGLSYFNRRSKNVDADVLFPFFWKMRHQQTHTTVVGPLMHSESPRGHDNWLFP